VIISRSLRLDEGITPTAIIGAADPEADGPSIAIRLSDGSVIAASGRVLADDLPPAKALLGINDSNIAVITAAETRIYSATALKGWKPSADVKTIPHAMVSTAIAQGNPAFLETLAGKSAFGGFSDRRGISYFGGKPSEIKVLGRPWDHPWIVHATAGAGGYTAIVSSETGDGDVISESGGKTKHVVGGTDIPPGAFAILDHPSHLVVAGPTGIWAIPRAVGAAVVTVDPATIKPKAKTMDDVNWWVSSDVSYGQPVDKIVMHGAVKQSIEAEPIIADYQRQIAWKVCVADGSLHIVPIYVTSQSIEITKEQVDYYSSVALSHTVAKGTLAYRALVGGPISTESEVVWPDLSQFDERVLALAMSPYDGSQLPGPKPTLQSDGSVLLPDGRYIDIKEGNPLIRRLAGQ